MTYRMTPLRSEDAETMALARLSLDDLDLCYQGSLISEERVDAPRVNEWSGVTLLAVEHNEETCLECEADRARQERRVAFYSERAKVTRRRRNRERAEEVRAHRREVAHRELIRRRERARREEEELWERQRAKGTSPRTPVAALDAWHRDQDQKLEEWERVRREVKERVARRKALRVARR